MDPGSDSPPIRIGVAGVGHLGRHHARLLKAEPGAHLVAVADVHESSLRQAEAAYEVPGYLDYRELAGKVDAVCVVVPTHKHREVAGFFLEHGIDVLVEKPITRTVSEGAELVEIAAQHGRILQVGHVERFNPALKSVKELGFAPRYIECQRMAPFSFRSTDIGVVLDLMIHDLDLVMSMMGCEVTGVEAFGGAVFTPAEDLATATLRFADGAVAHLTANRVAIKPMRRMRMFSRDGYVSLDFGTGQGMVIRKQPGWDFTKLDVEALARSQLGDLWKYVFEGLLSIQEFKLDDGNPLAEELRAFLSSVRLRTRPLVSGEDGVAAVQMAERVLASIALNRW